MIKWILIFLIGFPTIAPADDWRRSDTIRELTFNALLLIDVAQSVQNIKRGSYEETNFLLKKYPSEKDFYTYFSAWSASHFFISRYLNKNSRKDFQKYSIIGQLFVVGHNFHVGANISWK